MSALSVEERAERVRMALAEAGHPDADVFVTPGSDDSPAIVRARVWAAGPTRRTVWMAFRVVGGSSLRCWACFDGDDGVRPPVPTCLARGEGVEDCGRDRTDREPQPDLEATA